MDTLKETRWNLLDRAGENLMAATDTSQFNNRRYRVHVESVNGPRVGALYVKTNVKDADSLYTALSKKDCAAVRQIFPWEFQKIAVYWEGRAIRIEADWPTHLAMLDVRLNDIMPHPKHDPSVFFPGINEAGDVVSMSVSDSCPHILVGGTTGVGKSVAMQNIVIQLASCYPNVKLALIDAKGGEGLGPIAHTQGLVAPIAITENQITAALSWILQEMQNRYNRQPSDFRDKKTYSNSLTPLYIFLDEIQEVTMHNRNLAEIVRKLAAQCRAVKIHLFLSTQKPLVEVFGNSTTKSNVPGRLALMTVNYKDSELIVGSNFPRADYLKPWEAWCISPAERYRRAQLFNVTEKELLAAPTGKPEMDAWPIIAMSDAMGQLSGPVSMNVSPKQGVISIFGAKCGIGRGKLQKALEQAGVAERNSTKAGAIRDWGREALQAMKESGYELCKADQQSDQVTD